MKKVVIVGAGPGGLAAAMLLAKSGQQVTVLEKQAIPGGRTSTHGAGGFQFDLGPTFFLYPRVLRSIFQAVGRDLDAELPMKRLDPQYHLLFGGGGGILATPNIDEMARQIASISPADSLRFARFIADNRTKLAKFRPCLEHPFTSFRDIFTWKMLMLLPRLRPWLSLDQELGRYFSDARIRLAFSFQSKYLGMSPFQCPSLFSILSFLEYEHGVWHPIGGCGAVSRCMARIASELGADIRFNAPAERIEVKGRRAVGVHALGRYFPADAIVVNGDFSKTIPSLVAPEHRRKWTDQKIAKSKFSCSTFMMYLGVEGVFPGLQHHTIYMTKDYRKNLRDIETDHRLCDDPSFYVQNPGYTDSTMAPAGHSALYVLVPVSHQHENIDWSKETAGYRQKTLEQLKKVLGIDLTGRIRHERIVTPDQWESQYSIYRGATFSMAHNLAQMLHKRPQNRYEDLEGVYLTGGGTHPGSGLPVIYESARISSRLLLQDLGLPWEHCSIPKDNDSARPPGRLPNASSLAGSRSLAASPVS